MSDELHALLSQASSQIEGAAPALERGRLQWVRAAVRRRRIVRRTAESVAGVGVVGVIGVGLWIGVNHGTPEPVVPVVTPTVAPSVTPTAAPSSTPAPTSVGPPTRAASIDDETVIARLSKPRTGEVWQTPVPAPEVKDVLVGSGSADTAFLVGQRAGTPIYITVGLQEGPGPATVTGLYEIDTAGVRLIACPSARTTDPCAPPSTATAAGVVRDEATFYDTYTLPRSIDLGGGYAVTTTSTTSWTYFPDYLYGDAGALSGGEPPVLRTVRTMGAMSLVTEELESYGPEVTSFRYALTTPFGSTVALAAEDAPGGDFGSIVWRHGDEPVPAYDGAGDTRGTRSSVSPGAPACLNATLSRDVHHVAAQWRQAGETAQGQPVFVPVEGGNPLSLTVRGWQESHSWGYPVQGEDLVIGAAAGYPYLTDEAFLAARALYALQGPTGEWLLALRSDAESVIWECA
ncbi:hypothetical protein ACPPVS_04620 [Cellulomonas sp. McL0617]|uniref:hypothetical protein n=1 Tax=Cellulomonas sp. McL0617 TaxID=3415675 RepID=UPI003CF0CE67